jgi:hypothetical protein
MPPTDSDAIPPPSSIEASPGEARDSAVAPGQPIRLWSLALGAGVLAGLVSWLGGEACRDLIKPPRHAVNSKGLVLKLTDRREGAAADAKNAGLAFVILGAALGGGLGVAGGLVRRSARVASWAGLVGLVTGAAAAGGMSLVLLPAYNAYQQRHPDEAFRDLVLPLLVHAGVWSAAGAAGGLAFGLGLGQRGALLRAVIGGFIGAAVGAMAYELIGAAAFPAARTAQFVSATWETRLLARLAVTVLAAAGTVLGLTLPREPPAFPAAGNAVR